MRISISAPIGKRLPIPFQKKYAVPFAMEIASNLWMTMTLFSEKRVGYVICAVQRYLLIQGSR